MTKPLNNLFKNTVLMNLYNLMNREKFIKISKYIIKVTKLTS
jgi:hypothetical protein